MARVVQEAAFVRTRVRAFPGAHLGDQGLPLQLRLPPRGEASGQGIFCL